MKKALRSLLLFLLAGVMVLSCACTGGKKPDETLPVTDPAATEPAAPTSLPLVRDGKAVYDLIRVEICSDTLIAAGLQLRNALNEATGSDFSYLEDAEYKEDNTDRYEILIGATNRPESKAALETLGNNEYLVKIEGKKVLLLGKTDALSVAAVKVFTEAYVTGKTGDDVVLPLSYSYTGEISRTVDTTDPDAVYSTHVQTIATNASGTDKEYIVTNTAAALPSFRFVDGGASLIYKFDISAYTSPSFTLLMHQEYRIDVSDKEKGPWKKVSQKAAGATEVSVKIDPFSYGLYDLVYIRFTDPTPQNGGGAAVSSITLSYYDNEPVENNVYYLSAELKEAVLALSSAVEAIEIEGFGSAADGGMIYNMVSGERTEEQLHKYDGADRYTGKLTLGDRTFAYSVPKNVTAYDAVPVDYKLTLGSDVKRGTPLHISVTGQEDREREGGNLWYDLNMPGKVDVTFDYEGYVTREGKAIAEPKLSYNFATDRQASNYPSFRTGELIRSGTVKAGSSSSHWFKFRFTNTGDTVLDGDGNGTFCFYPELFKKSGSTYSLVTGITNRYIRIIDEVYPGEEGEFWLVFPAALAAGDYQIRIQSMVRNEIDSPENWSRTIWDGTVMSTSTFAFKVSSKGEQTEPELVKKTTSGSAKRNKWMHYYEEFQSSYLSVLKQSAGESEGTIYVQPSPWCNQLVIKLIDSDKHGEAYFTAVSVPVKVESDSLKIELDPDNPSYVVLEDGTRFPAIMTQSMADMRINLTQSPDPAQDIVKYLCEIKDLGINVINTTAGFCLSGGDGGTAFDFSMDVAREIGLKVEGFVTYPYQNGSNLGLGTTVGGNKPLPTLKAGEEALDAASGLIAKYQFMRWGDNYWVNGDCTVLSVEDTRGGFGITTTGCTRPSPNEEQMCNFRVFAKSLYGTIAEANKAWGTKFKSFSAITFDSKGIDLNKWGRGATDYDLFLALRRANNYRTMLNVSGVKGAKVDLRLEGSHWIAKVDPHDKRQGMRFVLMNQHGNGLLPIVNCTDSIYCCSDYTWEAFTPSEVADLSRSSWEDCHVVSAMLPLFNRMRDIAMNHTFGQSFKSYMNVKGQNTKGVQVNTTISLYEWWKATYENHGVPGILWSDFHVDGYATMTQRREIAFFVSKLKETIATPEGQKWAKEFTHDESVLKESKGVYSYDPEFVRAEIEEYYANK